MKILQKIEPTLRCRPDLVHGIPVARETRRLAAEMPKRRFQLKPPLFIVSPFLGSTGTCTSYGLITRTTGLDWSGSPPIFGGLTRPRDALLAAERTAPAET